MEKKHHTALKKTIFFFLVFLVFFLSHGTEVTNIILLTNIEEQIISYYSPAVKPIGTQLEEQLLSLN